MKLEAAARLTATQVTAAPVPAAVKKLAQAIKNMMPAVPITLQDVQNWLVGGQPDGSAAATKTALINKRLKNRGIVVKDAASLEAALKKGSFDPFTHDEVDAILDFANAEGEE